MESPRREKLRWTSFLFVELPFLLKNWLVFRWPWGIVIEVGLPYTTVLEDTRVLTYFIMVALVVKGWVYRVRDESLQVTNGQLLGRVGLEWSLIPTFL